MKHILFFTVHESKSRNIKHPNKSLETIGPNINDFIVIFLLSFKTIFVELLVHVCTYVHFSNR